MIVVDTSVWIDHLRFGAPHLAELLGRDVAASHDFGIGEIACGNLKKTSESTGSLRRTSVKET